VAARVVLADDHPLFLQALQIAIEEAGITVAGCATRGDELLELMAGDVRADAVLIDLQMPGVDGYECIAALRRSHPDLRLIVISATDEESAVRRALDAGAVCFIGKSIDPNDLAAAIRALLSDAVHLDVRHNAHGPVDEPAMTPAQASRNGMSILTKREIEILQLTADGLSNSQMAKLLWVTEQTVKFHLSNIYRKIDVRNRTEASRWAQQHGVLDKVV
jgi:DNA-binding NarL/FixJ family response regulator